MPRVAAGRVAQALRHQHVLQPDAEPAACDAAVGEQRVEYALDRRRRDHQCTPARAGGGHADQPAANGQHWPALVGTEPGVEPQQRLDAAAGLTVPCGAGGVDHAEPAGGRAARIGADDQRQRAGARGAGDRRQSGAPSLRQAQDGDVGAGVAAGQSCLASPCRCCTTGNRAFGQ